VCSIFGGLEREKRGENQLIRNLHSSHQLIHECGIEKLFSLRSMHDGTSAMEKRLFSASSGFLGDAR
jgi:hypothetical protein